MSEADRTTNPSRPAMAEPRMRRRSPSRAGWRGWLAVVAAQVMAAGCTTAPTAGVQARLDEADARHLLGRTGFAPSPAELQAFTGLSREQAVGRLLAGAGTELAPPAEGPAFTREAPAPPSGPKASEVERRAERERHNAQIAELRRWWLARMLATPAPLAERMVLFWHNHFATSEQKVRSPLAMWRQHELLRRHALGDFGALSRAIARDPAMLVYLDGTGNRAGAPNENFAREVMELFTLGEGQYGERDIREAARAFTGWAVDRSTWTAEFRPRQHDGGEKLVLGQRGRFDADGVIDVLLAQESAPRFIADKLWREFVSPAPQGPAELADRDRVAAQLRADGWRIDAALRTLLQSESFWAADNRAALIKSPVDLVLGSLRQFDMRLSEVQPLVALTNQLGQSLFAPPNVKGWPGQMAWIDSTRLLERKRFAERLLRAAERAQSERAPAAPPMAMAEQGAPAMRSGTAAAAPGGLAAVEFDAAAYLKGFGAWPDREPDAASRQLIEAHVLARAPVHPVPAGSVGLTLLRSLALDPAFQLK